MSARPRLTAVAAAATMLAALSLASVFRDGNWFWPVVLSISAAAVGCALSRLVSLPRPLAPLVGLAAVALVVTWIYARDSAVLGVFPGRGAFTELNDLASAGFAGMRKYATPAPTDDGLVMLAAAGAGAVAVVVDMLAVTYRSAALAGVPLLVLYAVPITVVRGGVPWLLFVAAALGWLALMLAEGRERLAGWGRALGRRSARENDPLTHTPPEPLGVVGRRIGAAAVGLALVMPALLPWAGSSLFKSAGGGVGPGGSGLGQVTKINPVDQLGGFLTARSETTLLTYTSTDNNPDYLRVVTLDHFNGTAWLPASLQPAGDVKDIPTPFSSGTAGLPMSTRISIKSLVEDWLPVPYPGGSVDGLNGAWSYDGATDDVFRTGSATTQGQNYTVDSLHIQPTGDQLNSAGQAPLIIQGRFTALPSGTVPATVRDLADSIVVGQTTDYGKAVALQNFFLAPSSHFTYTTNLPSFTGNPLVAFLRNRAGFCQQFAGAFAVMARLEGLPTRIEIGFTPGSSPDSSGLRRVTNHNAHAWPEVYFNNYGWVRFEPTVSGTTGALQPVWASSEQTPTVLGQGGGAPASRVGNKLNQDLARDQKPVVSAGPAVAPAHAAPAPTFPWALLIAVLAVVVLLLPGVARFARRRGRLRSVPPGGGWVTDAHRRVLLAWQEMSDTARDLNDPWPAARTPRRTAAWLASGVSPQASAAARRLAGALERVRYAPEGVDVLAGCDPGADARLVVAAMEARATPRDRWRSRMVPVSVLAAVSERLADVLDWTDIMGARARDMVRRAFVHRRRPSTAEAGS